MLSWLRRRANGAHRRPPGRRLEREARAERAAHLTYRNDDIRHEIERFPALEMALADAPDGQISLTSRDARAVVTRAQHSGHLGNNLQNVVDTGTI